MTAYPEGGYIGFYPSKPVWVGKALPETARQPEGQFRWDAMAEIELSRAIPGTELHICRDGLIILRIEELQEGISKAMRSPPLSVWESAGPLLNRYLGHCNTLRLLLEAGLWKHDRLGMGTTPIRKGEALLLDFRHQMLVGNTIPEGEGADLIRQRIPGKEDLFTSNSRTLISSEIAEEAFTIYLSIADDWEKVKILSETCSCLGEQTRVNWEGCIIHAWFVIEYYLNSSWMEHILAAYETEQSALTREMRDYLSGKDLSAAVISNELVVAGKLPRVEFETIDRLRKIRNSIIHNQALTKKLRARLQGQQSESTLELISQSDCEVAVSQVENFINKSMGIGIKLPRYFVWTYP
jgi:hypothetical protein